MKITHFAYFISVLVIPLLMIRCFEGNPAQEVIIEDPKIQDSVSATLKIAAVQFADYTPVLNASITLITGKTALTDSNGVATFTNLSFGSYQYIVSRIGYTTMLGTVEINLKPAAQTEPLDMIQTETAALFRSGVSIAGSVYCQNVRRILPAIGATVELKIPQMFQKNLLVSVVDSSGDFIFSALPELSRFKLTVRRYSAGNLHYTTSDTLSISPCPLGDTAFTENFILSRITEAELLIIDSNADSLQPDDTLKVIFSDIIDTASITHLTVQLVVNDTWTALADVSSGRNVLYVKPTSSDWSPSRTYSLFIHGLSGVNGSSVDDTITGIQVFSVPGDVVFKTAYTSISASGDTVRIDYNTDDFWLEWNDVTGVSSYEIYEKRPADDFWNKVKTTEETFSYFSTPDYFAYGDSVMYKILAVNSRYSSNPDSAKIIVLKDVTPPGVFNYYADASSNSIFVYSGPDTIFHDVFLYSKLRGSSSCEPLDTATMPSVTVSEGGGNSGYHLPASNIVWQWTSQTEGTITLLVPVGKDASGDTVSLDFSGVTDIAGNPVDTAYGSGMLRFLTE